MRTRIRPALWLAAIALLCLCGVVATAYLRSQAVSAIGSEAIIAFPNQSGAGAALKPDVGRKSAAKFDEKEAKRLAFHAANAKARELYGCEPFDDRPPLLAEQTGWKWTARRGHGVGDFEATVQLGADGAVISTEVLRLIGPSIDY